MLRAPSRSELSAAVEGVASHTNRLWRCALRSEHTEVDRSNIASVDPADAPSRTNPLSSRCRAGTYESQKRTCGLEVQRLAARRVKDARWTEQDPRAAGRSPGPRGLLP
jgi:hypothetical protein